MIEIKIQIDEIDYSGAAELALDLLEKKMKKGSNTNIFSTLFTKTKGASLLAAKAALKVLPQSKKDELAVELLRHYKEDIATILYRELAKKNLDVTISSINIDLLD